MEETRPEVVAQARSYEKIVAPGCLAPIVAIFVLGGITMNFDPNHKLGPWWFLGLFLGLWVVLGILALWINKKIAYWTITDGVVAKGGRDLFSLSDVEAVQLGLPDILVTKLSQVSGMGLFRSGRRLQASAELRRHILIVRLTGDRWFLWNGTTYENGHLVREALIDAADEKSIEEIPEKAMPLMRLGLIHRVWQA